MGARETFMNTLQTWLNEGLAEENGHVPAVIMAAFNRRITPSDVDYVSNDYWCAITMGGAAFYAGAQGDNMVPKSKACRTMANKAYENGTWISIDDVLGLRYEPQYGDIFIQLIGKQEPGNFHGSGHTGAVVSFNRNNNTIVAIDGNNNNMVREVTYNIETYQSSQGKKFVGFIHPRWELATVSPAEYKPGSKKATAKAAPVSSASKNMFGKINAWCDGPNLLISGYILDTIKSSYAYTADVYLADSNGNNLQYIGYRIANEFLEGLESYGGGKHKFEIAWDYAALSKYGNGIHLIKMYGRDPNNSNNKKLIDFIRINITCKTGQASQVSSVGDEFYPIYLGTSISIWDALESLGIDGTYNHRKQIAVANNIENYKGTAEQNIYMLGLLKEGKLIRE